MPDAGQTNRGSFSVDKSDAPTLDPRERRAREVRIAVRDKSDVERIYLFAGVSGRERERDLRSLI